MDFIDLKSQQKLIRKQIERRINAVLDHGKYIMGPEVDELEAKLANYVGRKHCVSCASGTDALLMSLIAMGIGRGDLVFVPAFTFVATAEVVSLLGAEPVFVDVDSDSFNICLADLERAYDFAVRKFPELKAKAVISVDLFGQLADYESLDVFCRTKSLCLIQDAAQSFGASYRGARSCSQGELSTTSFFPAKPLGAYGDGGAVFCDDDNLLAILRSIRTHGQGVNKYQNVRIGINGRLDTIQAAILLEKLEIFDEELKQRQLVADRYHKLLKEVLEIPKIFAGNHSTWAQYTIKSSSRENIISALRAAAIPHAIYYLTPLHQQPAFQRGVGAKRVLPICEALSQCVLSLPMHSYLDEISQERIAQVVYNSLA
jgi:dTDP-4-amino-4,6-dideoxygalactose transaminase